jgi:hypothetical protein
MRNVAGSAGAGRDPAAARQAAAIPDDPWEGEAGQHVLHPVRVDAGTDES